VTTERHRFTKAEREYVKGIVRNLSFQRLTDNEIMHWLQKEKKIDLDRSTISKMRNQVEEQAEEWYIGLRESGAKYIAIYKERLDSLLSYQKKLHEIITQFGEQSPELVIRAISELHRLELSLHILQKELPDDIATSKDKAEEQEKEKEKEKDDHLTYEEWMSENTKPRIGDDSQYTNEENGKYYWDLHIKYNKYVEEWKDSMFGFDTPKPKSKPWQLDPTNPWSDNYQGDITTEQKPNLTTDTTDTEPKPKPAIEVQSQEEEDEEDDDTTVDIDVLGRQFKPFDVVEWIECTHTDCSKWFKNKDILNKHFKKYHNPFATN
jgi:hypothetical protein